MREKVLRYVRETRLLRAGDRLAIAVSGGADSVALLRVLLDWHAELGIVLAVAHFNHGLREEAAADEAFVEAIARAHGLEFFVGRANVRDHAFTSKLSIEAAGRELRYRWFASLAREQRLDAVATAHTRDDQAETVLLKLLRGAGTRGLAGIYPVVELRASAAEAPCVDEGHDGTAEAVPLQSQPAEAGQPGSTFVGETVSGDARVRAVSAGASPLCKVIRPLLCVTRGEVEDYLASVDQQWREDESNLDRRFLRNRVRHELLPLLEQEFNPKVRESLSDLADIARGEEEYWRERVESEVNHRLREERFELAGFASIPLALQRRLLMRFAERQGATLDFAHIERLRSLATGENSGTELPGGLRAEKKGVWLTLCVPTTGPSPSYRYPLPVPGEVRIAELNLSVRAYVVEAGFAEEQASGELLSLDLLAPELVIRNWLPGDRFWPAHSRSEEKLKRLFLEKRVPAADRPGWPVLLNGDEIVWVRGFPVASSYRWRGAGVAVRIEAISG